MVAAVDGLVAVGGIIAEYGVAPVIGAAAETKVAETAFAVEIIIGEYISGVLPQSASIRTVVF